MKHHHGVSGKSKDGKSWIDQRNLEIQKKYIEQSKEIGRSDNLYGRIDLDDQIPSIDLDSPDASLSSSQIIEALERSPEIDVSRVHVHIRGNIVLLQGKAESLKEVRAMISIVKNLKGVSAVKSELNIDENESRH